MNPKKLFLAAALAFSAVSANATVYNNNNSVAICDLCTVSSTININQHYTITDLDVMINSLNHTFDADLFITITHNNTTVNLVQNRGGSGDNFTNTTFDDGAATAIASAAAPFTGTFRPEQLLSAFNNQDAFGDWILTIADQAGADVGSLNRWGMAVSRTSNVPEPASLALLALGLAGVAASRRRAR